MQEQNNPDLMFFCKNLRKDFSDREHRFAALRDLSFSVSRGEFVCVVGPSGCGKSTLLRTLAGLLPVTSGEIHFGRMDTSRPHTAMVFQGRSLFPWMNVLDNVAFGLEMQGVDKKTRLAIAADFLEKVGLKHFQYAFPHTLSGGMYQRVAILRAFLADPEVLLMDEPFGMLDAQTRIVMQEELLKLWQERRHTVVYITHDIEEAIFLGDRVLVMSGRPGRVLTDIHIDLPRPREHNNMMEKTMDIRVHIWEMLHDEVARDLGVAL